MLYDINKTFADHWQNGLNFTDQPPKNFIPPPQFEANILGYRVSCPIGIAACPLGTSKGIKLMSQLGFGIFTYKTIRSVAAPAHPLPNIGYIHCDKQLSPDDLHSPFVTSNKIQTNSIGIANSFGNASFDGNIMAQDIAQAKKALSKQQLLIVSVYGTQQKDRTLVADYLLTAQIAQEAGAQIIECNVSCPNIPGEQPLYKQPEFLYTLLKKLCSSVDVPVIVKVCTFHNKAELETALINIAQAGAQGVSLLNTIPAEIITQNNRPYFGDARKIAGISGDPIRSIALQHVKDARAIIDAHKLNLTIFGSGGITKAEHIDQFYATGANIAMSATGAMHNPYLAMDYFDLSFDKLPGFANSFAGHAG